MSVCPVWAVGFGNVLYGVELGRERMDISVRKGRSVVLSGLSWDDLCALTVMSFGERARIFPSAVV